MIVALTVIAALAALAATPFLAMAAYIGHAHRRANRVPDFPFMLRIREAQSE